LINILLDQGLPRSASSILRDEGWNVLHTGDISLSRYTDKQILEKAPGGIGFAFHRAGSNHALSAISRFLFLKICQNVKLFLREP